MSIDKKLPKNLKGNYLNFFISDLWTSLATLFKAERLNTIFSSLFLVVFCFSLIFVNPGSPGRLFFFLVGLWRFIPVAASISLNRTNETLSLCQEKTCKLHQMFRKFINYYKRQKNLSLNYKFWLGWFHFLLERTNTI